MSMIRIKRFFRYCFTTSLLTTVVVAWFAPLLISWWNFSPPVEMGVTCKPAVIWGMETYRKVLLGGVVMGFIFGALLFFAFRSKKMPSPPNKIA